MKKKKIKVCAYCGLQIESTKDHVIPGCLYPEGYSGVERLTIPACNKCNENFSKDEAHFRTMLSASGSPNDVMQKLIDTTVKRSLEEVDGHKCKEDVRSLMELVDIHGEKRYMIYPAKSERFMKIIRKIVRGLCHHHEILPVVSDQQVFADVMRYAVPPGILERMTYNHYGENIFKYWYQVHDGKEKTVIDGASLYASWLLTFYGNKTFYALVTNSENGFLSKEKI